jgi:hypothetical protein
MNGVHYGNNWWMGEQNECLYLINIETKTWYKFVGGKNKTL